MKKFIQDKLARDARRLLGKTKPAVVAVTGSVGKSSAKQAILAVLGDRFGARASVKNYNTEFGVPLTVLGLTLPKSKLGWLPLLWRACARATFPSKNGPKTLILEMAADRPGDIGYLCGIAKPDFAVVTAVGESHAENFKTMEGVAREKGTLVENVSKSGWAVLNRDDARVWAMRERTKSRIISFGFAAEADVRAQEIRLMHPFAGGECGTNFKLTYQGSTVPVLMPGVLGKQSVYAALAAAAVGLVHGLNLVEIAERLRRYEAPPGRMRALEGIKRTVLIDDTYNSAPVSAVAALETLRDLPLEGTSKRFAVLGDMLELGGLSVAGHEQVGRVAVDCGIDYLIFVGELMGEAEKAALAAGHPREQVFHFSKVDEAGRFVQEKMRKGDAVLVKASRGMRLERVTKELMADPMEAERLLVSVDKDWKY